MDGNKSEAKVAWLFNLATQRHSRNLDPTFLTCKLCCKIPKEEEHEAGEEQDRGQKNAQVLEELLSKQLVVQQQANFSPRFHLPKLESKHFNDDRCHVHVDRCLSSDECDGRMVGRRRRKPIAAMPRICSANFEKAIYVAILILSIQEGWYWLAASK